MRTMRRGAIHARHSRGWRKDHQRAGTVAAATECARSRTRLTRAFAQFFELKEAWNIARHGVVVSMAEDDDDDNDALLIVESQQ